MEKALPTLIVSLFCVFFLSCAAALNPIQTANPRRRMPMLHSPKKDEACSALQRLLYGRPRDLRGADRGVVADAASSISVGIFKNILSAEDF